MYNFMEHTSIISDGSGIGGGETGFSRVSLPPRSLICFCS